LLCLYVLVRVFHAGSPWATPLHRKCRFFPPMKISSPYRSRRTTLTILPSSPFIVLATPDKTAIPPKSGGEIDSRDGILLPAPHQMEAQTLKALEQPISQSSNIVGSTLYAPFGGRKSWIWLNIEPRARHKLELMQPGRSDHHSGNFLTSYRRPSRHSIAVGPTSSDAPRLWRFSHLRPGTGFQASALSSRSPYLRRVSAPQWGND
jgi:hypothetical protein